jgi:hypothetical protein
MLIGGAERSIPHRFNMSLASLLGLSGISKPWLLVALTVSHQDVGSIFLKVSWGLNFHTNTRGIVTVRDDETWQHPRQIKNTIVLIGYRSLHTPSCSIYLLVVLQFINLFFLVPPSSSWCIRRPTFWMSGVRKFGGCSMHSVHAHPLFGMSSVRKFGGCWVHSVHAHPLSEEWWECVVWDRQVWCNRVSRWQPTWICWIS